MMALLAWLGKAPRISSDRGGDLRPNPGVFLDPFSRDSTRDDFLAPVAT
jgi:hypothetical protein